MPIMTFDSMGPESPAFAAAFALLASKSDLANYMTKADAQTAINNMQSSIDSINRAILPGTYTVATLPMASANQAKYAFVTDLGGGADMVLSDGTYWKHIRTGASATVAAGTNVQLTALVSAPNIIVSGSGLLTNNAIRIQPTGTLYPGYQLRVTVPSGLLGLTGTIGVALGVSSLLPLLNGSYGVYEYNGSSLVKVEGGNV